MKNRDVAQRRARTQRILLGALTGLLIAFSAWCVFLFWRSLELRADLDHHLGWIEDLRSLRGDLDRTTPGAAATADLSFQPSERMLEARGAPELQIAAQNLSLTLDRLRGSVAEDGSEDQIWEATATARSAATELEDRVQDQVARLHGRLGNHWTALYALIVASLLLAASNLGLLHLAHQRRLRLEEAHDQALQQSTQDSLTRIWNRDAILQLLRRELARSERAQTSLGVILADIDGFQQVNVLLGQDQGDFILEQLAGRLGKFVRPYDTMGRFGGDSFLVVLPLCDDLATGNVADRLREAVNERDVEHALGRIRVTISLAYATVEGGAGNDADLLIHRLQERVEGLQAREPGRLAKL